MLESSWIRALTKTLVPKRYVVLPQQTPLQTPPSYRSTLKPCCLFALKPPPLFPLLNPPTMQSLFLLSPWGLRHSSEDYISASRQQRATVSPLMTHRHPHTTENQFYPDKNNSRSALHCIQIPNRCWSLTLRPSRFHPLPAAPFPPTAYSWSNLEEIKWAFLNTVRPTGSMEMTAGGMNSERPWYHFRQKKETKKKRAHSIPFLSRNLIRDVNGSSLKRSQCQRRGRGTCRMPIGLA